MGINADEAKAILALRQHAGLGTEILCLGRPELFISPSVLRQLNARFSLRLGEAQIAQAAGQKFADAFLGYCGFTSIRSLDASAYEGADIVHDLNKPIPRELKNSASFIYDGGTIEHVFDVATALSNVVKLLKVGGTALLSSPANGQCGHGFYQFSPELFYRFFEANGFDRIEVYLVGLLGPSKWFRAIDPRQLKKRVQFMTSEPVQMLTIARKTRQIDEIVTPQQSDYADLQWDGNGVNAPVDLHAHWRSPAVRARAIVRDRLLYPLAVQARHMLGLGMPALWRRAHFLPVDPFVGTVGAG